ALVEDTDLADERRHGAGQQHDHHPQDDVRDDERLVHAAPRSRASAGACASRRSSDAYSAASVAVAAVTVSASTHRSGRGRTGTTANSSANAALNVRSAAGSIVTA